VKTGAARLSRLGAVLAVLAVAAAGTVGLSTFGWLPNLRWHPGQHDSLVAEAEGELSKIESDTNTIHIGSASSARAAAAFVVTGDTRLVIENKEAGFGDLREGMRVKVVYERRDDTRLAWSVEASTVQNVRTAEAAVPPIAVVQPIAAVQPSTTAQPSAAPPPSVSAQPSAAPAVVPAAPESRPGAGDIVSSQSPGTEPSRVSVPTSPTEVPSTPPPRPGAGVGTPPGSRVDSSKSTRVSASRPRPRSSSTLKEIEPGPEPGLGSAPDTNSANVAAARLSLLRRELASAEVRFGSDDPRVVRLRNQIQKYESLAASEHDAPSQAGVRAANSQVRDSAPVAGRPPSEEPTGVGVTTRAQRSTPSPEPERFDSSAVVDWLLKDRGQTLPDVGTR
jgi:hypothetical protein